MADRPSQERRIPRSQARVFISTRHPAGTYWDPWDATPADESELTIPWSCEASGTDDDWWNQYADAGTSGWRRDSNAENP